VRIFDVTVNAGDMLLFAYAAPPLHATQNRGTAQSSTANDRSERESVRDVMTELGPSPLAAREANLSVAQARAAIAECLRPIDARETVPLAQALGRVLAQDVTSPIDVPAHDNSAMDGYAFAGAALRSDAPLELRSVATVMAGTPHTGTVGAGQCVRIMTGAVMPAGTDTVVPL
jgi:molybdopterin molybdotransferase